MNWKRGLFRLWLLASILWFAGSGSIAVLESSPLEQQRTSLTSDASRPCDAEAFLDSGNRDPQQLADFSKYGAPLTDVPQSQSDESGTRLDKTELIPLCASRVEYVRDWNMPDQDVVSLIIGVPVLVLGLGAAIAWVVGGFRKPA
jgi:hypothetical protein